MTIKKVIIGLLSLSFLYGCATTKQIPPTALVKLPGKKIVKVDNQPYTKLTPLDEQLSRQKTMLEMSLTQKAPTPIWIPPLIAKVLIMPYIDKSEALHTSQYVFIKLKDGKWLIGNYLMEDTGNVRVINPLKALPKKVGTPNNFKTNRCQTGVCQTAPQPHPHPEDTFKQSNKKSHSQIYFQNTVKAMEQGG